MNGSRKERDIIISDQVAEQMAGDPELADEIRGILAAFRQAEHAVATGQHKSFEDALEAITGNRPEPVEFDDPDDAA